MENNKITLYHVPRTISSPIVQCLIELGVMQQDNKQVTIVEKDFPDLKKDDYLQINPMGTVPALVDESIHPIMLFESGAILDYLLERFDGEHRLHPPELSPTSTINERQTRAKYLQLKQYIIATVYPFIASLGIHVLFQPKEKHDPVYIQSATEKITTLFIPVLEKYLGNNDYFLGETMSAVDFLLCKPLNNLHQLGLLEKSPSLSALFQRISSRPSWEQAYSKQQQATQTMTVVKEDRRSLLLVPYKDGS
jgi:glutathione S-transferase